MNEPTLSDLAAKCIRCGFCLESCPTFLETGEESESPRGRIYLAKSADRGEIGWEEIRSPIDHCLGCRGCETACPSGVEYGHLLEMARSKLGPNPSQQLATQLATRPTAMRLQLAVARIFGLKRIPSLLQGRLSPDPQEATIPPVERGVERAFSDSDTGEEVAFLEGCAMRVLFPNVHAASRELLGRAGYRAVGPDLGCCGALHAHAGMHEEGAKRAREVSDRAGGRTVVTNSAGCGSWLKECGVKAMDLSEAIASLDLSSARWKGTVTYHDACHLAHGQGIRKGPRDQIQSVSGVKFVELEEADLCCGSAGTYNLTQPKMARRLLERKWVNIEKSGAQTVVLGNPGCHAWIRQASLEHGGQVRVMHLAEFLAEAFQGYASEQ